MSARAPMALPQGPNQRWSPDFVSDTLISGGRIRILAVVDDLMRERLALAVDTSLSHARVARELDAIIAARGVPPLIVSDNGTELTSLAILRWTQERPVECHYIAPGKPQQNGHVESLTADCVTHASTRRSSCRSAMPARCCGSGTTTMCGRIAVLAG